MLSRFCFNFVPNANKLTDGRNFVPFRIQLQCPRLFRDQRNFSLRRECSCIAVKEKNLNQKTSFLERRFSTLESLTQERKIEGKKVEDWTENDVQNWFSAGRYVKYAPKFPLDGKELAGLTEAQFQKELGNIQGSVIYNAVQELKVPTGKLRKFDDPDSKYNYVIEEMVKKVKITQPPDIKPKEMQRRLGRFRKEDTDLPFSGSNVDPRLLDDELTVVAKEMVSRLIEAQNHFILLGKSGTGKTRSIFDVARNFYTVYMECVQTDDRKDVTKDKSFSSMADDLYAIKGLGLKLEEFRNEAKRRILLEFVSRFLYLLLLLKKYPETTPQGFLAGQLNGGQDSIQNIVAILGNENIKDLEIVMRSVLRSLTEITGQRMVVAVDEAGLAFYAFREFFESPRTKSARGILTPIVHCLMSFDVSTIFAATNKSLGSGETLQSDIGKPDITQILTHFESTEDTSEIEEELSNWIDLSECNLQEIPNHHLLVGRYRLVTRVLYEIPHKENPDLSKQEVLKLAINSSVSHHRTKLTERFLQALQIYHEKQFLENFYAANFLFGGTVTYFTGSAAEKEMDLVEIGLASLRREPTSDELYLVEIREPLSVEVINSVLAEHPPLKDLHERLMTVFKSYGLSLTMKGSPFETLALGSLCLISKRLPLLTVADFVKSFLPNEELPEWAHKALFYIEKIASPQHAKLQDELEYAAYALDNVEEIALLQHKRLKEFEKKKKKQESEESKINPGTLDSDELKKNVKGLLLSQPSTAMRPDAFQLSLLETNSNKKSYWGLVISAKLYGDPVPSDKIKLDFFSTDLTKVYYLANGVRVNPKALKKRQKWEKITDETKYDYQGSLRLHILLPSVSTQSAKDSCRIEENDIIIYIDMENAASLFDEETVKLLKKATRVLDKTKKSHPTTRVLEKPKESFHFQEFEDGTMIEDVKKESRSF